MTNNMFFEDAVKNNDLLIKYTSVINSGVRRSFLQRDPVRCKTENFLKGEGNSGFFIDENSP